MNAPSPGIVAAAIKNQHYDTEEQYLHALGEALRVEYEAIVRAGFVLQIDAPDLALERHISYKDEPLPGSSGSSRASSRSINRALREHAARPGPAAHLLGQFRIAARLPTCRLSTSCRRCSRRRSAARTAVRRAAARA